MRIVGGNYGHTYPLHDGDYYKISWQSMNKNIILIHEQTGCPYMIIKKALWATNDNVDEAIKLLREKYGFGDYPKVYIKDWEIKYDKRNE